jgi:hypothetical protein
LRAKSGQTHAGARTGSIERFYLTVNMDAFARKQNDEMAKQKAPTARRAIVEQ